jgi:glycosyltransferase involved in cell wall biosynthesis
VRLAVVSALGRIDAGGVVGYGGIERACFWLASELARRKHDVLLFGNVDGGPSPAGWTGVNVAFENALLSDENLALLRSCDAVSDWTHARPLRLAGLGNYWATVMYTDAPAYPGRNVYPSRAVREAFKEPGAPVVPIGIPVEGSHTDLAPHDGPYACFGRIAQHKGVDLSVAVAAAQKADLRVAGHVWPGIDEAYAMTVAKRCRDAGFGFARDPPNGEADGILRRSRGLLHLHRWLESFSIVAAEALCYGTPVLTTDQGAPQEWVRATDGGVVASLKDLEAGRWDEAGVPVFFATKWESRREGIAKRARELFALPVVAARYEKLFEGGMRR